MPCSSQTNQTNQTKSHTAVLLPSPVNLDSDNQVKFDALLNLFIVILSIDTVASPRSCTRSKSRGISNLSELTLLTESTSYCNERTICFLFNKPSALQLLSVEDSSLLYKLSVNSIKMFQVVIVVGKTDQLYIIRANYRQTMGCVIISNLQC